MDLLEFIKTIDTLVYNIKQDKDKLAHFWCSLNAKMYPEFNKDETKKIMDVIEETLTKEYCLKIWGEELNLPASSRANYDEEYRKKRIAIISKMLVDGSEV